MKTIEMIVQRLGYDKSKGYFRLSEIDHCDQLSLHDKRILCELSPYAFYVTHQRISVLFFDDLHRRSDPDIQRKIWNFQIPIIISDEGNRICIYNGIHMNLDLNHMICLEEMKSYDSYFSCDESSFSCLNLNELLFSDEHFDQTNSKSLNYFLIDNLKYITKILKEDYHVSFAHRLILRILFIRYLIDRGINIGFMGLNGNVEESQKYFLSIVKDKNLFFQLTEYLNDKFHGILFDLNEKEKRGDHRREFGIIA